ncbi:MAG: cytochrome c3 family protein, partial [Coriobacteriia bacterium]|nr:cytochrome c3 family protein [Coriobacteriia bacterium]
MGPAGVSSRAARRRVLAFALGFALVSLLTPASALAVVRGITPPAITRAPVAPAGLPAPSGLSVTSGNMVDSLRWTPVRSTLVAGYRVERSSSASGPWTLVTARTTAASLAARVRSARTWYYRVRTVAKSGAVGNPCAAVSNETLALSAIVSSRGATLRASNGALTLSLPRGTFLRSTRVRVRPVAVAGSPSLVRVTSAYDFYASAALRVPARVTVRYRIPVMHFQVANTVARDIDWTYLNNATGIWAPVTTTINTAAGTLTATMPHFSYWQGAYTQPHGTTPATTPYCNTACHNLSMSPVDASAISIEDSEVCYHCHGNANPAATKAVLANGHNIESEFFACDGQILPAAGSTHPVRRPHSTTGLKCTSCHDPHLSPTKSPKLLRSFAPVTGKAIVSRNGTLLPASRFCAGCHGTVSNEVADALVPGYWERSGGGRIDFSRFEGSVHEAAMKPTDMAYGCSGCHKPHASADETMLMPAGAIDRTSDTSTDQALSRAACYGCHSGTTRRTWNNRDIKVEFARASHHPIVAEVPDAEPVASTVTVLEQSSRAEFASLGPTAFSGAVVEDLVDAVRLGDDAWVETYAPMNLLFAAGTGTVYMNQFDPATGMWNSMGFTPPNHTYTTTGSGLYRARQKLYQLLNNGYMEVYTPADGSTVGTWTVVGGPASSITYGSDMAVDEGHGYAYHTTAGGASVNRLDLATDVWTYGVFSIPFATGTGSAVAYSPSTDQLFVINRNGTGGDGRLYAIASPSTMSGAVTPRDTGVTLASGAGNMSGNARMVCASIGGADYIFAIGGYGSGPELRVVSDLTSSTPTLTGTGKRPFTSTDYPSFTWDGGEYLYANQRSGIVRIRIPSDPVSGVWGEWQAIASPPTGQTFGFGIAFQEARPLSFLDSGYKSVGTVTAPLTAPDGATSWGRLDWTASVPASTSVSITLQRPSGADWVAVEGFANMTGGSVDLSGVPVLTYPRLRLVARLATENKHIYPRLLSWRATAHKARPVHREPVLVPESVYSATAPTPTVDTAKAFEASLTVATLPESIVYTPVPDRLLMYLTETETGEVLQYDTADNAWNTYSFDPADYTRVGYLNEQPSSFAHGGYIYTVRPHAIGTAVYPTFMPYIGLQTGASGVPTNMGATPTWVAGKGIDTAVDAGWQLAYISRGNGGGGRIDFVSPNAGTLSARMSMRILDPATGQPLIIGEYSSIAYVPWPVNKLFVIQRNGASGNGRLYSVQSPGDYSDFYNGELTVTAADTSATVAPGGAVHMTRINKGGTDYLVVVGPDTQYGSTKVCVVSNLSATTQTVTWKDAVPLGVSSNMQVEWDGADAIYLHDGGYGQYYLSLFKNGFAKIPIPANPVADAWPTASWSPLPTPPRTRARTYSGDRNTYSSMTLTTSPVRGIAVSQYASTTTTYSPEVLPTSGATQWGVARWTGAWEAGVTTVTVTVQGSTTLTGGTFADIPGPGGGYIDSRTGAIDLGSINLATWKRLRLKGVLQSSNVLKSPRLTKWSVWCGPGTGRWTSPGIHPDNVDTNWGAAAFVATHAAGSSLKVTVQRSDLGVLYDDVPGFVGVPIAGLPVSLGTLTTASHPYIRLVVDYVPAVGQFLSTIEQAAVTSAHTEDRPVGAMTCASCHNVHNVAGGLTGAWDPGRVSDPQNTRVRSTDVTSTVSGFCLRCHTTKIVRKSAAVTSLVPWDVLFAEQPDSWFFTGFDKDSPGFSPYQSAHFTTSGTKAYCETCHDPHGSDNEHLTAWTRPASWTGGNAGVRDNTTAAAFEERLCLQCHGNGTVGMKAPGAPDVATPLAGSNSHPVRTVGAVHSDTETTATLGGANRHAECVDCHDPHTARAGIHTAGSAAAGGALYGVIGIEPRWGSTQWTAATGYQPHRLQDTKRDPESYLCFKCHTDVVSRPTTGTSGTAYSDLTVAFNPNNMSYHNVLGLPVGAQTSFIDAGTTYSWPWRGAFKAGWTKDSGVTCTGCHTNEAVGSARGPHGSSAKYMLDNQWSLDFRNGQFELYVDVVRTTDPKLICNKCHDFANSGNTAHHPTSSWKPVAHSGYTCNSCHIAVPHGWKRPRL